jgi:hypothetical protein
MKPTRRDPVPEPAVPETPARAEQRPVVSAPVADPKITKVYQVIGRIRHLGKDIEPGDLVELPKSEADRLFRIGGAIKEV